MVDYSDKDRWNNPFYKKKRLKFDLPKFSPYQPELPPIYPVPVVQNLFKVAAPINRGVWATTDEEGNPLDPNDPNRKQIAPYVSVMVSPEALPEGYYTPFKFTFQLTDKDFNPITYAVLVSDTVQEIDLYIDFVIKGSATYQEDYDVPFDNPSDYSIDGEPSIGYRGSILLPAGQSSTELWFTSINDDIDEEDETIIIGLSPNSDYNIYKGFSSAKATITTRSLIISLSAYSPVTSSVYPDEIVIDEANTSPLEYRFKPLLPSNLLPPTNSIIIRFLLGGIATYNQDYIIPPYDNIDSGVYATLTGSYPISYSVSVLEEDLVTAHGTFTHKGEILLPEGYLTQYPLSEENKDTIEDQLTVKLFLYPQTDDESDDHESIFIAMAMSRQFYRLPLDSVISYIVEIVATYKFKVFTIGVNEALNPILKLQGFGLNNDITIENSINYERVGLTNTGLGYIVIAKLGDTYLFDVDGEQTALTLTTSNFSNNVIPDFQWYGHDWLMSENDIDLSLSDPRLDPSNLNDVINSFLLSPSYSPSSYAFNPNYDYSTSFTWIYFGSSDTELSIGTGVINLFYSSSFVINVGETVRISNDNANYMIGVVTSRSSSVMYVNVTETLGSGTFNLWTIERPSYQTFFNRDTSQRAFSCTLNEIFLELFYLLPYRHNDESQVYPTATQWINIDPPSSNGIYSNQINWSFNLPEPTVETTLNISVSKSAVVTNEELGSFTLIRPGFPFQVIPTIVNRTTEFNLNKTVTRNDTTVIPFNCNLLNLNGLTVSTGNITVDSDITMNRVSDYTKVEYDTPSSGSGGPQPPVRSTTYPSFTDTLTITDGSYSVNLTDALLNVGGFNIDIVYTSLTTINSNNNSQGFSRNINIDHTFTNNKDYDLPSVIHKGIDCLMTENTILEIQVENRILTDNWDGITNTGLSYTRKKKHLTPPQLIYKLFITGVNDPIIFDKVGSNIITETNTSVLEDIENNVASITLANLNVEIGNVSLFGYLVDTYPSETTVTLTNPNYFTVQTLGGTVYGFPTIPTTDSTFSQRIFLDYSIGSNVVALHCFCPTLDVVDYVSELYFKVEGISGLETQFSVSPHTRRQHGGKTICTNRPSYIDNKRTLTDGSDPTVTLDGLPMLYNYTITNIEYTENELTKQRGIDVIDVEVYVISNNLTKRYDATLTDYVWDTEEDYCDIPDYLWFCGQKKVNLSSVTLNIDYETETTLDYYCWSTIYDNAVIIITKDNHTTSAINYIKNNNKNVNMYVENDIVRIAIASKPPEPIIDNSPDTPPIIVPISTDIGIGDTVTGVIPTSGVRDNYYKLVLDNPTYVTIRLSGLEIDVDLYLYKQTDMNNSIGSSTNGGTRDEVISLYLSARTYYIKVSGYDAGASNYSLTVELGKVYADIYEFDTAGKKFIRIGNDESDLSMLDSESAFISYHP